MLKSTYISSCCDCLLLHALSQRVLKHPTVTALIEIRLRCFAPFSGRNSESVKEGDFRHSSNGRPQRRFEGASEIRDGAIMISDGFFNTRVHSLNSSKEAETRDAMDAGKDCWSSHKGGNVFLLARGSTSCAQESKT